MKSESPTEFGEPLRLFSAIKTESVNVTTAVSPLKLIEGYSIIVTYDPSILATVNVNSVNPDAITKSKTFSMSKPKYFDNSF